MPVEISPVNAPWSSQWQFSVPTPTFVPAAAATAAGTSIAGVQHTISTLSAYCAVASATAFTSAAVSDGLTFIFQFPAMILVLIFVFLLEILVEGWKFGSLEGWKFGGLEVWLNL